MCCFPEILLTVCTCHGHVSCLQRHSKDHRFGKNLNKNVTSPHVIWTCNLIMFKPHSACDVTLHAMSKPESSFCKKIHMTVHQMTSLHCGGIWFKHSNVDELQEMVEEVTWKKKLLMSKTMCCLCTEKSVMEDRMSPTGRAHTWELWLIPSLQQRCFVNPFFFLTNLLTRPATRIGHVQTCSLDFTENDAHMHQEMIQNKQSNDIQSDHDVTLLHICDPEIQLLACIQNNCVIPFSDENDPQGLSPSHCSSPW